MFHVALHEPEIPANTGNVGRLCVGAGCVLHLVGGLGFRLDDRRVRRAGLDHWDEVQLVRHPTLADFEQGRDPARLFCFSARAIVPYTRVEYRPGDALLFGSESRGLPEEVLARHAGRVLVIPVPTGMVRSVNLANAVAVVLYEALRQVHRW
jgi:tRNA (cytidine/uridine-2'-O-)-methyltransferase